MMTLVDIYIYVKDHGFDYRTLSIILDISQRKGGKVEKENY